MRNYLDLIIHKLGMYSRLVPDKFYLSSTYRLEMGTDIDWNNPQTFTEKLQWLKIYNRNPLYTKLVDKDLVKKYVANCIGKEYIIPTLASWDTIEEVDINKLPDQFVLKCTHDSGCVIICKDKKTFDWDKEKVKLQKAYNRDFYLVGREWPYKNVPKRILAEKFMEDDQNDDLLDYKFFCFNGEPKLCQVIGNRRTNETIDFYDMDWNHIPGLVGLNPNVSNSPIVHNQPQTFETMKEIACKLSSSIPFARIDLYEINGNCFFGEITFYPNGGFGGFIPNEYNTLLGKQLMLDKI